jgi:hypothetical protein
MVLLTGLISIKVPNFAMFLDFSGAFSMTFLAFIMPVTISLSNSILLDPDVSTKFS